MFSWYIIVEYLVYNKTSNCVKSIELPLYDRLINIFCEEPGADDTFLDNWERVVTTRNIKKYAQELEVFMSRGYDYVYCYPSNITINGRSERCPPSMLKIQSKLPYKTGSHRSEIYSDRRHGPLELIEVEDNIHFGHFDNDTDPNDEMEIIDTMFRQMREIDDNFLVNETWGWTIIILAIVIFTALLTTIIYLMYFPNLGFRKVSQDEGQVYYTRGKRSRTEVVAIDDGPTGDVGKHCHPPKDPRHAKTEGLHTEKTKSNTKEQDFSIYAETTQQN